jgi:hypothetical protein
MIEICNVPESNVVQLGAIPDRISRLLSFTGESSHV